MFNKNPLVKTDGKIKEEGKIVRKYEEIFNVTVKYFEGNVDFVQEIKMKAVVKTNISGSVEFMGCNNEQCLPLKIVPFNVVIN